MCKIFIVICLSLFSFLDGGEVKLHSFRGNPGNYIAIQDLHIGKITNDYLSNLGVQIEITQLNSSAGTISIKVADKAEKVATVLLNAIPVDKVSEVTSVTRITSVGKGTIQFAANGDLGPESYLEVHLKDKNSSNFPALEPMISLLVKGKEIPMVNRYRIILNEARENTGLDIRRSQSWTVINRKFMWLKEGLFNTPHPDDEIKVDFFLKAPSLLATKIDRIIGDLIMSIDETHELKLDLALGKLEHPELAKCGIEIEVTKLENNKLEITYSNPKDKLYSLALDPRGLRPKNLSERLEKKGGIATYYCTTDLPLNRTGLTLTLIDSSKEIKVPFELKDLSLIGTEKPIIGKF